MISTVPASVEVLLFSSVPSRFKQHCEWIPLDQTPILAALQRIVQTNRLPLHVPGHRQGRGLPEDLGRWLGPAAKLDLTELPGLDNLHHPEGCILASQRLAAAHYGAEETLYSVNGSTAGVMAAIMATAQGKQVVMAVPFHESAWRGLVMADASPVFLPGTFDLDCLEWLPPTPDSLDSLLARLNGMGTEVAAVYVTSPTYTGIVAPVARYAEIAHRYGATLLVDEAHGAHFGLIDLLPPHSVACGADVVVQSVHKMLPGLTQTAWVHRQGGRVEGPALANALRLLLSTSPSYLLLASLDAAQAWLRTSGAKQAGWAMVATETLREKGFAIPVGYHRDPLRHWLPTGSLVASRILAKTLEVSGAYVEYADAQGVLSVFGLFTTAREVDEYIRIIGKAGYGLSGCCRSLGEKNGFVSGGQLRTNGWRELQDLSLAPKLALRPRQVWQSRHEWMNPMQAVGRIAGEAIVPYPPGVPLVYPGQVLTEAVCKALNRVRQDGYDVQGIDSRGQVAVVAGE